MDHRRGGIQAQEAVTGNGEGPGQATLAAANIHREKTRRREEGQERLLVPTPVVVIEGGVA